jgi:hypothetical protein
MTVDFGFGLKPSVPELTRSETRVTRSLKRRVLRSMTSRLSPVLDSATAPRGALQGLAQFRGTIAALQSETFRRE